MEFGEITFIDILMVIVGGSVIIGGGVIWKFFISFRVINKTGSKNVLKNNTIKGDVAGGDMDKSVIITSSNKEDSSHE